MIGSQPTSRASYVLPDHEQADVEAVVEQHSSYLVVEKTGEARAEIEREHPRLRHSDWRAALLVDESGKNQLDLNYRLVTGSGTA